MTEEVKKSEVKEQKVEEKKEAPKRKVAPRKIKAVEELAKTIDGKNTIMFCSIKSLPASQFQKIKKQLSDKVMIKVVKKSSLLRALDKSEKAGVKKLKEYVKEDSAVMLSDLEPFELAGILSDSKSPIKAKVGQKVEYDIEVEAGPTELMAGPIVSELGSLGLEIEIKDGKIEIKKNKVILKAGDEVNEAAESLMAKLDMKPFSIGFIPMVAYDTASDKVYTEIKINKEATLEELKQTAGKALGFAINIGETNSETIKFLLSQAGNQEKVLAGLVGKEQPAEEKKEEAPAEEEKKEESAEEKPAEEPKEEEK